MDCAEKSRVAAVTLAAFCLPRPTGGSCCCRNMLQDQTQFLDHLETGLFKSTQGDLGASPDKSVGVVHLRDQVLWEKKSHCSLLEN